MLTVDDVRAVPLFSTLAEPELERLAQTSADLHLATGEFAAHQGAEERALFVVLSGKIEVIRLFDGVERTLGWRVVGNIFGEPPIALGTPLYGSYRASEPSRVGWVLTGDDVVKAGRAGIPISSKRVFRVFSPAGT